VQYRPGEGVRRTRVQYRPGEGVGENKNAVQTRRGCEGEQECSTDQERV